ncbi:MAG: YvcK family protein [Bacilli bacterium]
MKKNVVIFGGGTGLSTILKGLKQYPLNLTAVVSVCDDGKSTGRLREEFNILAVGDLRRVIISLSETEPLVEQLFNYRFKTTSDLNGHTLGNLLLTAMTDITENFTEGIESFGKVINLKGTVLPLTDSNVTLMGIMEDNQIVRGEYNITNNSKKIKKIYYEQEPLVNPKVLKTIEKADCIILSMGSVFTSIIPNLLCDDVIKYIDKSKANIMYICNMMTQPGETTGYKVSDHIKLLNKYLGKRKINTVIVNNGHLSEKIVKKYETLEQKDPVVIDHEKLRDLNVEVVEKNFVSIEDNIIRHNKAKLAFQIFSEIM